MAGVPGDSIVNEGVGDSPFPDGDAAVPVAGVIVIRSKSGAPR